MRQKKKQKRNMKKPMKRPRKKNKNALQKSKKKTMNQQANLKKTIHRNNVVLRYKYDSSLSYYWEAAFVYRLCDLWYIDRDYSKSPNNKQYIFIASLTCF